MTCNSISRCVSTVIKRAKIFASCEDSNTVYVNLFGKRLLFRNGKYNGWYNANLKKVI